jgi:plasmid maintenance system antidote protein VapI
MNIDEIKRVEKIIELQNMKLSEFANEIGIKSSTLTHILNGRNNVSLEVARKIVKRFPNISFDWLILGNGSMFRKESNFQEPTLFDTPEIKSSKPDVSRKEERPKNTRQFSPIQEKSTSHNNDLEKDLKLINEIHSKLQTPPREITKIIVYFDDNTFKEFGN